MPKSPPESSPPAGTVVLLIDESVAMRVPIAGGTKSKADSVATAVNSVLNQLSALADVDVALVGYRTNEDGSPDVGLRWAGPLAGRRFVSAAELPETPIKVEERIRRVPGPGGVGILREEAVRFPIWYVPDIGGAARLDAARSFCTQLLAERSESGEGSARPPLVLHICGELPAEEAAVEDREDEKTPVAVFCHAHLGSSARIPPTLYPASDAHLPPGPLRNLFQQSSPLPPPLAAALRTAQVHLGPSARGLVYNASMGDLIRFLSLARAYAAWNATVEPASEPAPTISRLLVMFVLDRSVAGPRAAAESSVWQRLQQQANELLAEIAQRADGWIDVALVAYGADASGAPEVETTFRGPLADRAVVSDKELAGGPLRTDEVSEQVSNGIGGLVTLMRKRPVWVDLAPAAAAPPEAAFAAAAECLAGWYAQQSNAGAVLVHVTRGCAAPEETAAAVAQFANSAGPSEPWLYHLVLTESPYRSIAYPDDPASIDEPRLQALCRHGSPLAGAALIVREHPTLSLQARGLVVNGRFDLLPASLEALLRPSAEEGEPA